MVDLVTVEVIKGALIYAAEEMGIALRNSAYSPNIKERMDFSCTLFDHQKRLEAQAEHIPVHLGSMGWAVREGLDHFEGLLEKGDMLLFNDPYISGTHLPDITLIAPIFSEEEVIGYAANKAHHSDVGGKAPGSMAGDATELYQEGIIIPPVRFVKCGEVDRELSALIMSNIRTPEVRLGDIRAQVAANLLGERRMKGLAEKYGIEVLRETMTQVMDYSERMMRKEIEKMPEGRYEAEDYLESTGVTDELVKIKVAVTVRKDGLKIDYTGTSGQAEGPVNAVFGVTLSGVYYVLRCLTDPSIPMNDGGYRPVEVYAPKGTVVNPIHPAPVAGGNVETSQRNVDALLKAFAQIVPEKVCAACQGTMNNVAAGGTDAETGGPWTFYETIAGGFGGRKGLDGVDGVHTHMTNTMNTPIEAIEGVYPMRFLRYELRIDSGGAGKWRGGVGVERSWKLLSPSATLSILAERTRLAPWGLYGGKSGMKGEFLILKPDGTEIRLKPKCTVKMKKGDVFVARTPGGGGYGNPLERSPEEVSRDVVNGLVSRGSARKDYGVVMNPETKQIDWEATRRLREDSA
ncbi:MAG: hydantoinase B/oxoprolinase family protein [Candidatus Bathyarchaeota archaeon]|nr:MAG: hydantoinase B/oxoprolinase family protein [Candidatus Bathyarchaeota archaeon]